MIPLDFQPAHPIIARVDGALHPLRLECTGDAAVLVDAANTRFNPWEAHVLDWPPEAEADLRRGGSLPILPPDDDVGRSAAGWAAHLEMLACALAGAPIAFPFERFKATREVYRGQVASQASA